MNTIAINGFGRIGRNTLKAAFHKKIPIAAINDLTDTRTLAHLLKYDTTYGKWDHEVDFDDTHLIVDNQKIPSFAEKDPSRLPWKQLKIHTVLECTGYFTTQELASQHLKAGAKRVIISAPAKDDQIKPYIIGVNEKDPHKATIIDNASCTTNCIAPIIAILHEKFGVRKSFMTTVHAYTADQNLQDGPHKDLRRARAAGHNIVPTTTGAAVATTKLLPDLEGKFDGLSLRVPIITGSLSDFSILVSKKTSVSEVNEVLTAASRHPRFKGIIDVCSEPLVSSDIIGDSHSAIVDLGLTKVIDGDFVKVIAWYDNEWAYSMRLIEMAVIISSASKK